MSEISPPKIVIWTPNWLVDHVMARGFVKAVLDYYHESEVDLIVKSGFENLPLPRRGKVIVFDPEKILPEHSEKILLPQIILTFSFSLQAFLLPGWPFKVKFRSVSVMPESLGVCC